MYPLISLCDVSVVLPGDKNRRAILKHMDFTVFPGERVMLQGPNGSGKSTFLQLLAGEIWASSGIIEWNGEKSPLVARKITRLVSPLGQNNFKRMYGGKTGREIFALAQLKTSQQAYSAIPEDALTLLKRLNATETLELEIGHMSQGQLRLVLFVKALLARPSVLLLDEAFEGLDKERRKILADEISVLPEKTAIISTSHRELDTKKGSAFFLDSGHLVKNNGQQSSRIIIPTKKVQQGHTAGKIIIEIQKANVFVERELVLKELNWQIRAGENWKIEGPNGSGKSTLLRLLAGEEFVAAGGEIKVWSKRLRRYCQTLEEKQTMIRLVSDLSEFKYGYALSGLEIVLSGIDNTVGLYRNFTPLEKEKAESVICRFFDKKDWDYVMGASIRKLSSGQTRKVFLARAMMNEPEILLLDEPCSGLDSRSRKEYLELLEKLVYDDGLQLILVSHYMEDYLQCINRHAEMRNGVLAITDNLIKAN